MLLIITAIAATAVQSIDQLIDTLTKQFAGPSLLSITASIFPYLPTLTKQKPL
jgi:hypothetical protein